MNTLTPKQITDYALSKRGTYIDYPFGPEVLTLKVKGKTQEKGRIFLQIFNLKGKPHLTLNCDMMTGLFYRDLYPGVVVRGYHCPPVQQPYFNTFPLSSQIPENEVFEMIEHSYKTAVAKLPKYVQKELTDKSD